MATKDSSRNSASIPVYTGMNICYLWVQDAGRLTAQSNEISSAVLNDAGNARKHVFEGVFGAIRELLGGACFVAKERG